MLKFFWLLGLAAGQQQYDAYYGEEAADYADEYGEEATTTVVTTTTLGTTSTGAPTTTRQMANDYADFGVATNEEPEEDFVDPTLARSARFGTAVRSGATVSVNSVNQLTAELTSTGDIILAWDYDSVHTSYMFAYQVLIGNNENTTDWLEWTGVTFTYDDDSAPTRVYGTLTPLNTNTIYRMRIIPYDASMNAGGEQVISFQSQTTELRYQPGTIYQGGSGFVGQILLVTDFQHSDYVKTNSANDQVGYVTAVKITFPAACTNIRIDADVDGSYIYTDAAIAEPHRIFIFPQTHFSNQFSGAIKAFHFYVSGMSNCLTDTSTVAYAIDNSYLTVQTDTVDATTSPSNITVTAMWPADSSYPPVMYHEQQIVWFDTLIQQATHLGPSVALSAPQVTFSTGACSVYVNIVEENTGTTGYPVGWGYKTTYDSNLGMTDLFSTPGTTNYGTSFTFQALEWLNHIGMVFRYDTSDTNCLVISSSASIQYIKLNPAYTLTTATNPDQNAVLNG